MPIRALVYILRNSNYSLRHLFFNDINNWGGLGVSFNHCASVMNGFGENRKHLAKTNGDIPIYSSDVCLQSGEICFKISQVIQQLKRLALILKVS